MTDETLEKAILKQDLLNVVTLIARNMSTNLGYIPQPISFRFWPYRHDIDSSHLSRDGCVDDDHRKAQGQNGHQGALTLKEKRVGAKICSGETL